MTSDRRKSHSRDMHSEFTLSPRFAHMSENVYERHEDVMRDAVGDVSNRRPMHR